jgi:hypothetical protein
MPNLSQQFRVTFDTDTIDKATRPERFPKDPDQLKFMKVHEALKNGMVRGFICDTMITLEGIQNKDRATVFGSTTLTTDRKATGNAIELTMKAVQPARQPLPDENVRRLRVALAMGVRVLSAPRIANARIEDPDKTIYVQENDAQRLGERLDRFHEVSRAIEDRGFGTSPAKRIAERLANKAGVVEPWYRSLARANASDEKEFAKAVREWADSDTVAAHIAFQNDIFCTGDKGKSAGNSILDDANRAWLTAAYGVKFATIPELATLVPRGQKVPHTATSVGAEKNWPRWAARK